MGKIKCATNPDDCQQSNGNCPNPGNDGLPVQCVGPWSENKYDYLMRYLNATHGVREDFSPKGNSIYIDLFSGPGKCIIRNTLREIDSGVMIALYLDMPFNTYHLIDVDEENVAALKTRTSAIEGCNPLCNDSNVYVKKLVEDLLKHPYRYHFAYIDPFGVENLKYMTLKELAKLDRMDMLINYPLGPIRRNLDRWREGGKLSLLDEFLGTNTWRDAVANKSQDETHSILFSIFTEQLRLLGYPKGIFSQDPAPSIRNTKAVELYVLIFASRHKLGQKIWNSIMQIDASGQRFLKF